MRYHEVIVCALLLISGAVQASGLTEAELKVLEKIRKDPGKQKQANDVLNNNKLTPPAVHAAAASPPPEAVMRVVHQDIFSQLVRKHESRPPDSNGPQNLPVAPHEYSDCHGFSFLLRRDWKDIEFLGCPQSVDKATGAEIAFANDAANHNRIWSVNGTAAVTYSSITDQDVWWKPFATSFASYVTANRVFNSATESAPSNVDKLAYGGALELGYLTSTGGNNFLLRGGGVENNIKGTTSANFTAEYIPVYTPLYMHKVIPQPFDLPFNFRYDPELLLQYNQATGPKQTLDFNGRVQALRVGPQVSFFLFPLSHNTSFLGNVNASFTYHWSYETYAQKNLSWLQAALTYNIDDAGHLAVALTYQRGNDEDTGTFANIYRIGLTGKI